VRVAGRTAAAEQGGLATAATGRLKAYVTLTKPRIVELLLITTVPSMILAERGMPSLWVIAATLIGGSLSAAGANAVNQYLDRDIDEIMTRTRRRPLPAHVIAPGNAVAFGVLLGVGGSLWLWATVNLLAAALAAAAFLFYVFVYTMWLKRSSPQNIVIGGAAGAAPVLVGWAAVTGRVGFPAVVLFAIVFLWTPPHFWALALRYQRDYATAGVPMLPVVAGRATAVRHILVYSLVLVGVSLALWPVAPTGVLYPICALTLGGVFVARALRLRRSGSTAAAMSLFRYSVVYLGLLFVSVGVDTLLRFGL
jgi:protoheme IX farnesyltransferase